MRLVCVIIEILEMIGRFVISILIKVKVGVIVLFCWIKYLQFYIVFFNLRVEAKCQGDLINVRGGEREFVKCQNIIQYGGSSNVFSRFILQKLAVSVGIEELCGFLLRNVIEVCYGGFFFFVDDFMFVEQFYQEYNFLLEGSYIGMNK